MDADRFDDLLRFLTATPSRRSVLSLAIGGVLGALGLDDAEARKGKKGKKKNKRKKKKRTAPPPPPLVTRADAQCSAPATGGLGVDEDGRIAQTFIPLGSGQLTAARIRFTNPAGATGDFRLQVAAADAAGPTDTILATTLLPSASIPDGPGTHQFDFASPATVTAGTPYALILSHTASGFNAALTSGVCAGEAFHTVPPSPVYHRVAPSERDFIFATFVRS